MYVHLGGDTVVLQKDIIAIFDLELTSISKITREFLQVSEEEGFVVNVSDDLPKSYILTESDNESKVYISPISAATLLKRANNILDDN
ncbi:MAG: DUF370 domain-containing protein [Clostridia bacterium]|nr:DUF370 domain-containing protein [Clostridia bacterium]